MMTIDDRSGKGLHFRRRRGLLSRGTEGRNTSNQDKDPDCLNMEGIDPLLTTVPLQNMVLSYTKIF